MTIKNIEHFCSHRLCLITATGTKVYSNESIAITDLDLVPVPTYSAWCRHLCSWSGHCSDCTVSVRLGQRKKKESSDV